MASRILNAHDKEKDRILRFLRDKRVRYIILYIQFESDLSYISDIATEAKKLGLELCIVASMDPAVSEAREAYLGGTMPASRMMTLVGNMPHDRQLDVCALQLPELPLPFDELVMDRARLRKVPSLLFIGFIILILYRSAALNVKNVLYPGRRGLGRGNFLFWQVDVSTDKFTKTSKVII